MSTTRQLASFGTVGVVANAALYLLYLALTAGGLGHKTAMTTAFVAGVLSSYLLNRRWTFRHGGDMRKSAARFASTYAVAYAFNVITLLLLVDVAQLPHRTVMLGLIVATAALTFVLQKYWVFGCDSTRERVS